MPKEAVFTLKLDSELRDAFMAEAEASHRPASQVVRELMREFVHKRQDERDYQAFLVRKVEEGRAAAARGDVIDGDIVEAEFSARRELARARLK